MLSAEKYPQFWIWPKLAGSPCKSGPVADFVLVAHQSGGGGSKWDVLGLRLCPPDGMERMKE